MRWLGARSALILAGVAVLAPAPAHAFISVSSSEFSPGHHGIFAAGTSDPDSLHVSFVSNTSGNHIFRLSPATVTGGTACVQEGADAVCNDNASGGPSQDFFLQVSLAEGNDGFLNTSQVGAFVQAGPGNDRMESAPSTAVTSTFVGDLGNDTYALGRGLGPDEVVDISGDDFVDYRDRPANALGGNVAVDTDGVADDGGVGEGDNIGSGVDSVRGTLQAGDSLTAPVVDGELGADVLNAPVVVFGMPINNVAETRTAGVDVDLAAGTTSDGDQLFGVVDVVGTRLDDNLTGNASNNRLYGREATVDGGDILVGGPGDDILNAPASAPTVAGVSMAGTRRGTLFAQGEEGDDTIHGYEGGRTLGCLGGGPGRDTLIGTAHDECFSVGVGDAGNGGAAPGDFVDGGSGRDLVLYFGATEGVTMRLGDGDEASPASANSQGDRIVRVEDVSGTEHADVLTGNDGANALSGGAGDDVIDDGDRAGGAIARAEDFISGEAGVDTVDYARHGNGFPDSGLVIDLGVSLSRSPTNLTLPEDLVTSVENAIGTPRGDVLIGDSGGNRLDGGDGADVLQGRGGADALLGGNGEDLVSYAERSAGLAISLAAGAARPDGDTFTAVEGVCGTPFADTITGSDAADRLVGLGGNDRLEGRTGADTLGGETLSAVAAAQLRGCSGGGTAGADTLIGGSGADRLEGGDGVDTASYEGETAGVRAALANPPFALANSHGDVIAADIENLLGGSGSDMLVGNSADNRIDGGAGNDRIDGGPGGDGLHGASGADTIAPFINTGTPTNPTLTRKSAPGDDGLDSVTGGDGPDILDTRDARFDLAINCGTGSDQAIIDLRDAAPRTDCETQQKAEIDTHPLPRLTRVRTTRRRVTATLVCPRVRSRKVHRFCRGTATVRAKARGRTLGRARFSVRQGRSGRLAVRLRRATRRGSVVVLVEVQRNRRKRTTTVRLR